MVILGGTPRLILWEGGRDKGNRGWKGPYSQVLEQILFTRSEVQLKIT